ncbi:hypothetical protein MUK42_05261 [Musa troglodytarum]|uniref:FLZ-type domain-containing protein n=1 Tax=Musa troglodytarum TaxID=320322 RepID=A0A9E7H9X9_9LILI|nr:hypothetical protein MUK42_05261 [Musa troglodytarum]
MLSRNKGSIFHLEEDGSETAKTIVSIREPKHMRPASEGIEGLRILIHHKEQGSNVVTKSTCSLAKGLGFLKSCFLCKRELNPSKDEPKKGIREEHSRDGVRSGHMKNGGEDEPGELSWFSAGVRVGMGLGLAMCLGIGVGVGLVMRSYQAAAGTLSRFI